ncbi:unnamed protein product [Closterium sp. NIES-64]|nr:unnamed protein product [Closterium sp. NIES-64]
MKSARCTTSTCADPSAFWGWKRSFGAFFFPQVTWLRLSGPITKLARAWEGRKHHRSSAIVNEERLLHFMHMCGSFHVLGVEALVSSAFVPPGHVAALVWSYFQASKGVGGLQASSRSFRVFVFRWVTWLRFSGHIPMPAWAWEGCKHHRSSALANEERSLHFLHMECLTLIVPESFSSHSTEGRRGEGAVDETDQQWRCRGDGCYRRAEQTAATGEQSRRLLQASRGDGYYMQAEETATTGEQRRRLLQASRGDGCYRRAEKTAATGEQRRRLLQEEWRSKGDGQQQKERQQQKKRPLVTPAVAEAVGAAEDKALSDTIGGSRRV